MTNAKLSELHTSPFRTTARSILRLLVLISTSFLIVVVLLGFSGFYFAPGDSAAVIRPQTGALLIPCAALLWLTGARRFAFAALASAALAIGSVAPGFLATGKDCVDDCLTLYQKNLLRKAWPRYSLADDIIASGAEIVTLQEVTAHNRKYMASIYEHYGFTLICPFRSVQDIAVLTSLPVVQGTEFCLAGAGLAGVQVTLPNGQPIWALSIHLEWPYPFDQYRQSRMIADRIAELEGPMLIGGDFNMVPWGGSIRRIKQAAGSQHLGAYRNTLSLGSRLIPLPIDNVLVPKGTTGTVEFRPKLGSDHLGLLARVSLR